MLSKTANAFVEVVVISIASLSQAAGAAEAAASQAQYEVLIERDVRIPMRDGVELLADVYHPGKDGKPVEGRWPVILVRTSYNKEVRPVSFIPNQDYFVERGYVFVIEDVRGRYKSTGRFYHGIYEEKDGFDTIEWIAKQPWCNGKIGMTGVSYLAAVQQAAAVSGTTHLSSMFHIQAPLSYYQNGVRRGGAFIQMVVPIAFLFASTSREANEDPVLKKALTDAAMKGPEWFKRWPFDRGKTSLSRVPEDERFLIDTWVHPDYDNYWKDTALWEPNLRIDRWADVPAQYVGGWYDLYRENEFYSTLAPLKKSPIRLLMGPWAHGTYGSSTLGDVDFGPEAALSSATQLELQLRWFDQTLKGLDTGILSDPPVRIFVMGGGDGRRGGAGRLRHGGHWRSESTWPLPDTKFTDYYLHDSNSLSPAAPTESESANSYFYDPKDPVPTVGGASYYFIYPDRNPTDPRRWYVPYGPQDQRESLSTCLFCKTNLPLSARQDVLVFQTAPLDRDVEVTGPLTMKLWISSSAVDTDFTAKLIDVYPPSEDYPDGYAMNLADGILRTHYRNGFEKREMMKPGEVYPLTIPMFATANLFQKGHRIRVDISSSDYPAYDPNPNTGDPYMTGNHSVEARNTVYHDKARPSHIILPIISR
jgi:putative CocE/NonD family hydrolase